MQTYSKDLDCPVVKLFQSELFPKISQQLSTAQYDQLEDFQRYHQLSITSRQGHDLFDGIGSLYDYSQQKFHSHTSEFTKLNHVFENTAVEQAYLFVKSIAEKEYGVRIGRVRLMRLLPKTCLSYHIDPEEFRFHIPLVTNNKCFFVVEDQVFRMSDPFWLYKFQTNTRHTAVNASFEIRDHIVFDTYR
jgi:hypothetical protein